MFLNIFIKKKDKNTRRTYAEKNSLADELKAEQSEVLESYKNGTLKTYSSMKEYDVFVSTLLT